MWNFQIVNFVKYEKCEFWEKWDFRIVDFVKNEILKSWILSKVRFLSQWLLELHLSRFARTNTWIALRAILAGSTQIHYFMLFPHHYFSPSLAQECELQVVFSGQSAGSHTGKDDYLLQPPLRRQMGKKPLRLWELVGSHLSSPVGNIMHNKDWQYWPTKWKGHFWPFI